ncbi:MAG TPA: HAD-IIA family hydrolase [Opitutaceae bacterium]|nr:HAD-IIA family hydrolase [Opitutaceae bacterium]
MLPSAPSTRLTPDLRLRLQRIAHVALDMDGTIYQGNTLFPFTLPFLHRMKRLGIGTSFLTNNPSKSTNDYLAHLAKMGITATREELHTSTQATIDCLRTRHPEARRLFLLGTPSMIGEFTQAGYVSVTDDPRDVPDAVIVGFDLTLTYARLCRAAWWIQTGKPYLATNPDRVCPTDQPTVLVDCGSLVAALTHATGRSPDVVLGKPDPTMLSGLVQRKGLDTAQIAMVGDRIYTDILMAQRAHAFGVLVLSGETTAAVAAQAARPPDLTLPSLHEFGELLEQARHDS